MADRYFSLNLGDQIPSLVTEGGSTSGKAIELRVSDSVYASKKLVVLGVAAIKQYITTKETTPIA